MAQFKIYIQDKIENRVNQIDDLGYDEVEQHQKIAQITAAFYNQEIIAML